MLGRPGRDGDAQRLLAAMRQLVLRQGFREYFDPMNGTAHGATAFSWTAALYLDCFCGS